MVCDCGHSELGVSMGPPSQRVIFPHHHFKKAELRIAISFLWDQRQQVPECQLLGNMSGRGLVTFISFLLTSQGHLVGRWWETGCHARQVFNCIILWLALLPTYIEN